MLLLGVVTSRAAGDADATQTQPVEVSVFGASAPPAAETAETAETATRSAFADTARPAVPVDPDTRAVELGMRFSPTTAGTVTGIRFYKTAANVGQHVGSLWNENGELLARVTFAPATVEGWQSASLSSPVALTADREYVVSYTAESGAYSVEEDYFVRSRTVDGLRLPRAAGVYSYEAGFPTASHRYSNYFVDVVFAPAADPGDGQPTPAPTPTASVPPASASVLDETPSPGAEDIDAASVELGMRFSPKVDGAITAIRFFKTPGNSGLHRGTLWDADGRALARVTFPETSTQGWQLARLDSPVAVTAGDEYVVSYLAPRGRYVSEERFFDRGIDGLYLSVPATAGVYAYGSGGFPTDDYENSNYYVDVVFTPEPTTTPPPTSTPTPVPTPSPSPVPTTPAPSPTPTPTASPTPSPEPHGSVLDLPQEAWWGGPAYYSRFPRANAAGWDEPTFFPIAVFFGKPAHAASLAAIGVNTFMGAEHDGSPVSVVTRTGISLIAQDEWTSQEVGSDTRVVGWHVSDECDMGLGGCDSPQGEQGSLAIQRGYVDALRGKADGRFLQANFGNGVLGTYWSPTTMDDHVALMDVTSVDKYAYTSPHVQDLLRGAPSWPSEVDPASAVAYGWQQDRMETFMSPVAATPNWAFVETARPYLIEEGASTIAVPQIEGAVWNSIINGAAGIAYFQHNNDSACGNYSLIDCSASLRDGVGRINAEVAALAPVINSPSYSWTFGDHLDTALKAHDGYAYIFAMTDGGTGTRNFTLPPGVAGDIEVVGEDREIPVVDGRFSDDFEAEYSHRAYRIDLE
ncbi:DUF4082 domain-containing protein [Microbacterium sp. Sa4CUA7]|uniref:DUF4082 domain-containing protein n=1 Tax=Microbacterium pullorum TaxID=2762236 RepID=A0ABR8S503_9MICO|nr:DUF4082 domain-containing protein [Microbacterium pullorum]MBD7958546.1 DUF4082 domain-containing protein [Microbacterium pullorum]